MPLRFCINRSDHSQSQHGTPNPMGGQRALELPTKEDVDGFQKEL